jgi:hypothetical protein
VTKERDEIRAFNALPPFGVDRPFEITKSE